MIDANSYLLSTYNPEVILRTVVMSSRLTSVIIIAKF